MFQFDKRRVELNWYSFKRHTRINLEYQRLFCTRRRCNVFDRRHDIVLCSIAEAWKTLERIQLAVIVCSCSSGGYLDGIPLTCIFAEAGASPVRFPRRTRHDDVESDQPGFLEPADAAAIDRTAGSRLVSVTKGPKCAAFSLVLSLPPSPYVVPHLSTDLFLISRRILRADRSALFLGGLALKR